MKVLTNPNDIREENASRHQPGGETDEVNLPSSEYSVVIVVLEVVAGTFSRNVVTMKLQIMRDVCSALLCVDVTGERPHLHRVCRATQQEITAMVLKSV